MKMAFTHFETTLFLALFASAVLGVVCCTVSPPSATSWPPFSAWAG
jgi:hypothetical protein